MLSHHIVSALLAQREADLQRRAELARLRRPDPGPEAVASSAGHPDRVRARRRRRHLRLV